MRERGKVLWNRCESNSISFQSGPHLPEQKHEAFLKGDKDMTPALLSGSSGDICCHYQIVTSQEQRGCTDICLVTVHFTNANLIDANFISVTLRRAIHRRFSIFDLKWLYRLSNNIPDIFLRRGGLPDVLITYARSLIGYPIEYYSCFICYTSKDQAFAEKLHADLQHKGVRCWFALENIKIGDHYQQRIDEAIRRYDKFILILSSQAVQSVWVEREVGTAREKEDCEHRSVLFPIRLDDGVMSTTKAWAADVRRHWHIGDFTQWKDHDAYQRAFERLLRDLKAGETA